MRTGSVESIFRQLEVLFWCPVGTPALHTSTKLPVHPTEPSPQPETQCQSRLWDISGAGFSSAVLILFLMNTCCPSQPHPKSRGSVGNSTLREMRGGKCFFVLALLLNQPNAEPQARGAGAEFLGEGVSWLQRWSQGAAGTSSTQPPAPSGRCLFPFSGSLTTET